MTMLAPKTDKTKLMRGQVCNARARHNPCFADSAQEPDIPNGKARVIEWGEAPEYIMSAKAAYTGAAGRTYV